MRKKNLIYNDQLFAAPERNSTAIDEAPFVDLKPGLRARYGYRQLRALQPNWHSARVHSGKQIEKIARSMEVAGSLSPPVVDENWVILAGDARAKACKHRGEASIPVVQVFGLSEAQKRNFVLADNRIAEDAGWDREKLAEQIPELTIVLKEAGFEIADTGFEVAELDQIATDFGDDRSDPLDEFDPSPSRGLRSCERATSCKSAPIDC